MIRLQAHPSVPAPLLSKKVMEQKEKNAQTIASGKALSKDDFPAYWGNKNISYQITAQSIEQLERSEENIATEIIRKLATLLDKEYTDKKEFAAALKQALDVRRVPHKKEIVDAASYTIPRALAEHFHGKCCYCECKVYWKRIADVEHYRPKSQVSEDDDHKGYWWLAYDWENYFIACKICNSDYKSDHFPLLPGGIRATQPGDSLQNEKPVLVHPTEGHPETLIRFEWEGLDFPLVKALGLVAGDQGARIANELTGINHIAQMEARWAKLPGLQSTAELMKHALKENDPALIEKYAKRIEEQTGDDQEFAGFCRFFFRSEGLTQFVTEATE